MADRRLTHAPLSARIAARSVSTARLVRALAVPIAIALPPLFWVADATRRSSLTPLGRDQGIFQYVAWALRHGAVDYRDVRDVNGPLTHLVHFVFLALGGGDDHRFHVLDLVVSGAVFAFVGACVPGLGSRRPDRVERAGWAFAGWVVLSAQYLAYSYWNVAQRESFFDWFMLPSVALQLVAQARAAASDARRSRWLFAASGALSLVPWLGKPTYALFTAAQILTLLADDSLGPARSRARALVAFVAGGALGLGVPGVFLVAYGDPAAFARIQLADVPAMYRFIWPRAAADIFSVPLYATSAVLALGGAALVLLLVLLGEMPPRAILAALVPLAALAGVVVQGKGFPYHFHPVTAGVHLQWLLLAAWLAERTRVARRRLALVRVVPIALGVAFAIHVATAMEDSPYIRAAWLVWGAQTPEERAARDYFARFPEVDFFPYELRQTAAFLRAHTGPDDRVQIYGMDPYVLFLAERLSATPYLYAYDLDADAAMGGGTGGVPDDAQIERIRAIRDAHEADLLARVTARPPAAFVFFDDAPLLAMSDAWQDFRTHSPDAAGWVADHYREAARFGHDRVWLRLDLAGPAIPPVPAEAAPGDDPP